MKFHMTAFLGSVSMMVGFTASVAMADEAAVVGQQPKSNLRGLEAERDLSASKVAVCHYAPPNKDGSVPKNTLLVPSGALETHLAHGDTLGPCEDGAGGPDNNACYQGIRIPSDEPVKMTVTLANVALSQSVGRHIFDFFGPNEDSTIVASYQIPEGQEMIWSPGNLYPSCIPNTPGCEECPPTEPGGACARQLVHEFDLTEAFEGISCVGKVQLRAATVDGSAIAGIDLAKGSYYLGDQGLTISEPRVPFIWLDNDFALDRNTCGAMTTKRWILDISSGFGVPEPPFDGLGLDPDRFTSPNICLP